MTTTARICALLLASLLWLPPSLALGQTSAPPDPNEGAFGQTISAPDPTNEPSSAAQATPVPASGDGPSGPPAASTRVAIDRPASGATTQQRFTIMGWAVDPESTGTGVDAVYVYLDGEAGHGYFLGAAEYGGDRPDVATQLGQPRYGPSGYQLQVEVPPGEHTLYVYARQRGGEPRQWSAPATVDVMAVADGTAPSAVRQPVVPGGCGRAPDGTCLNRSNAAGPTCPLIDTDGQCLPARRAAGARGPIQHATQRQPRDGALHPVRRDEPLLGLREQPDVELQPARRRHRPDDHAHMERRLRHRNLRGPALHRRQRAKLRQRSHAERHPLSTAPRRKHLVSGAGALRVRAGAR